MKRPEDSNDDSETQLAKELLSRHDPDFGVAATRVLEKNRELYRRLR